MVRSKICEAGRGLFSIMVVRENGLRNMVKRNSLRKRPQRFAIRTSKHEPALTWLACVDMRLNARGGSYDADVVK